MDPFGASTGKICVLTAPFTSAQGYGAVSQDLPRNRGLFLFGSGHFPERRDLTIAVVDCGYKPICIYMYTIYIYIYIYAANIIYIYT